MSEDAGDKVHKRSEGNHDGCSDCIRQKKENEQFISIYERLQQVEKRASQVRQAVSHHKASSETNRSFYKSYEQRVINLPKVREKEVSANSMHHAGYEIAACLLEQEAKSKLVAENQKLKEMLFKMQKEKYFSAPQSQSRVESRQTSKDAYLRTGDSLRLSINSEMNIYESLYMEKESPKKSRRSELQKLTSSQETADSCQDNGSTQSSNFTAGKLRNSMDLSKYNDLNLWLYQSEKNSKLEEQLYIPKEPKGRPLPKRTGSLLPSIRR